MIPTKKAFIISPIGEEGSNERKHADNVLNYIIEPALKKCGVEPIRSDRISKPGLITNEMMDAIIKYDMSIAVLAFNNRNVYYELAIAQAANKPVIILKHRDEDLPFDIKDWKYVEYDLEDTKKLFEGFYVNAIVEFTKSIEDSDWKSPSSIPGFSSTLASKDESYLYFKKLTEFGEVTEWDDIYEYYQRIFNDSEEKLYLMGYTLRPWKLLENSEIAFVEKAKNGCKIKILILDPENVFLSQIHDEKLLKMRYEQVREAVIECSEFFSRCAAQSENFEFRQIRQGRLTQNQAINEEYCVYIPHFYSMLISNSPCWKFMKDSQPYNDILTEFNGLWELNAPISKERTVEEKEVLKNLQSKLTNIEDLIVDKQSTEAINQLNNVLESANLFNFEEIRTIAIEKLRGLRDPLLTQKNVEKILEFEYKNQRNITQAEMVTQFKIDISETGYYKNLLSTPVDYDSSEINKLEKLGTKILKKFIQPTLYNLIITLNYDLETAKKVSKFLEDRGFIREFRNYPLDEEKFKPPSEKLEDLIVFMSYALTDAETFNIEELSKRLKSYDEIKEVLYWQEHMTGNIIKFMSDNLGKCDAMLLFCSENALGSNAVVKEWTAADMMGKPIIPVFLNSYHIPALLRSRLGFEFDLMDFEKNVVHLHNLILKKCGHRVN